MKKLISTLLVVVILFNFILESNKAYADHVSVNSETGEALEKSYDAEKATNTGNNIIMSTISTVIGAIVGIIARVLNLLPQLIQFMMSATTELDQFTIKDVVFNKVPLFDINYFDFSTVDESLQGNSGTNATQKSQKTVNVLRLSVAKWYYIIRLIAIAGSLLVLIYIGIRMAMSTIAADKSRYKKMLIYWFESIIILFIMQYILSLIFNLGNMLTSIFASWEEDVMGTKEENNFELTALATISTGINLGSGWTYVMYSIVFWVLVGLQFKFYCNYFKRVLTVGFLVLISPLVTVTYAIDKVGDNKAQAFTSLIMELAVNVVIQPIHALIYLVFMSTAGEIANKSILISLIFMIFITRVEKFILHLFSLRNVVSLVPVNEERGLKI